MTRIFAAVLLVAGALAPSQEGLKLQWTRDLGPRRSAWPFTPKMVRDEAHVPVLHRGLVLVGAEHNGALLALDLATGRERWRFYTGGAIRFAPVADGETIFAGSDDGWLYAIRLDGTLAWKARGGPRDRRVIGHERLMSAWPVSTRPVAAGGRVFFAAGYWPFEGVSIHALDAASGRTIWTNNAVPFRPFGEPRVVGGTLFVSGHGGSGAFDVETGKAVSEKPPVGEPRPPVADPEGVQGKVIARAEAEGRLVVSTAEGRVTCFGKEPAPPAEKPAPPAAPRDTRAADEVLAAAGHREGWALVAGLEDGALVEALLRRSKLHVVAVDPDAGRVDTIRRRLDAAGMFDDHRLEVVAVPPSSLPPYFASLVCSEREAPLEGSEECLRPYGGALVARRGGKLETTRREGPLPGAADWSHEFCDAANTLASRDARVKAPLGVLWYGGPAADTRFYYDGNVDHQSGDGINPQPTPAEVVEGRMILQGPGVLAAIDIYTGRLLWESPLPKVYTFGGKEGGLGIHSKKHPEPWRYPEAMKFEVTPPERCRSSGFDMTSLPDGIWVGAGRKLLRFGPADGRLLSEWPLPIEGDLRWGSVRVSGELLVATAFRPQDMIDAHAGHDGNGGDWAGDRMPMSHLLVLDRRSGQLLWSREAAWGFLNRGNAIGGGKLYSVDLVTEDVIKKFADSGRKLPSTPPTLYALDLATGAVAWKTALDVRIKVLTYSAERDILLVPCRNLIEWKDGAWLARPDAKGKFTRGIPGRMRAFRGADGTLLWQAEGSAYFDPHVVVGDLVIDRDGFTYDLTTGKRNLRTSPLTGEPEAWSFRKGGCNHLIASPNLVTWRCAIYDLAGHRGVMPLTGMDAGCSPTLIPAGGVLAIANLGTHHKRNRSTAMALVHRPENDFWTSFDTTDEKDPAARPVPIRRVGYTFGAPGDRRDAEGTVWFGVRPKAMGEVKVLPKEIPGLDAGGIRGVASIAVPTAVTAGKLGPLAKGERRKFTVRLLFGAPGERLMNVSLEGRAVLKDFDGKREAVEFAGVEVEGALDIGLEAVKGETLLLGVELRLE